MTTIMQRWLGVAAMAAIFAGAEIAPAQAQPTDVRSALTILGQWQTDHATYHLRIETKGQFITQVSDLYCHPIVGGKIWKLDSHTLLPEEARMIYEEAPGDVVAYFPEIEYHVLTKVVPGYSDPLNAGMPGGFADVDGLLEKTKASSLTMENGVYTLTLIFDAGKLGINPPNSDIRQTIRFNADGLVREIEQQRLGLVQVSKLTYLTFNIDEVRDRMPVTPDPLLADPDIPFEKALEESVIYFAKNKQAQRNRL